MDKSHNSEVLDSFFKIADAIFLYNDKKRINIDARSIKPKELNECSIEYTYWKNIYSRVLVDMENHGIIERKKNNNYEFHFTFEGIRIADKYKSYSTYIKHFQNVEKRGTMYKGITSVCSIATTIATVATLLITIFGPSSLAPISSLIASALLSLILGIIIGRFLIKR